MAKQSGKRPARLGHYEIIGEIGSGGMAVVYKGIQTSLNRTVAIKVLPESFARDEEFIARFDREAETIARLNHPNIIQIIDRGKEGRTCYFVMEYVDGTSLDSFLREKSLTLRQMIDIALQICDALSYAHARGVVHRDLKPSNILIERNTLRAKVADFGLVQLAQTSSEMSTLTQSNIAMGTIEYMAPEQRKDARAVDHRADIFSLGIILYEMFTGQLPVGHFKRPGELNGEIPRALDDIIFRCLKPNPADRYQSADEVAADLRALLRENSGALDLIVHTVKRAKERASTALRNRPRGLVIGAVAVICIAAAFLFVRSRGRSSAPATGTGAGTATRTVLPARKEPPAAGAEADFRKAETYARADMKSPSLREFAVMSMRYVVENYKESDPQWAERAQMRIGQIYEEAGENKLAIGEYKRLLALFPSGSLRAEAHYRIAECLKPQGFLEGLIHGKKDKVDRAIEAYRRVYEDYAKSPFAAPALFETAMLQASQKTPAAYAAAIETLETLCREYPKSEKTPEALAKIASLCLDKRIADFRRAVSTYERIVSHYPESEEKFHALLNIAKIKDEKMRDGKAAIMAYRRVIREKPGTEDALEANRRLERLLQMSQSSRPLLRRRAAARGLIRERRKLRLKGPR